MDDRPDDRFASPAPAGEKRRRRWRIPEHPLFHLALLAATFVTTTLAGGFAFTENQGWLGKGHFADGYAFSIPALLILGSHELAHYCMCRRYGLAATPPYFLPSPLVFPPFINPFGTFGALIKIKEPLRSKSTALRIGAAGPIAGFIVAIPFLVYGVTRAQPHPAAGGEPFGYPLIVRIAQTLTGVSYSSQNVLEHPTFMAAWFGFLVTGLNLLPVGQLDGGHVLKAIAGRRQTLISRIVVLATVLGLYWVPQWAFFLLVVSLLIGIRHPDLPDEESSLPFADRLIALVCLVVFVLCFIRLPVPFWH